MSVVASEGPLTIRLMRDAAEDYGLLVRWRGQPHVHEWWDPDDPAPSYDEVVEHYGPRVRAEEPTAACIIELEGRPVGYLQFYRWLSYEDEIADMDIGADPDTFGIDIHIGEPELIGRGIGSAAVDVVCRHLEASEDASWIALTTEVTNTRAQRAYEKAGFVRVRRVLDTDTRDGERVECWLMERRRPE